MNADDIKRALIRSIENFEAVYPEWENYRLLLHASGTAIEIESADGKVHVDAAKELLRDFAFVLKENNLMITSHKNSLVKIDEYSYLAEEGLEELADELEAKLGRNFSNLKVSAHDDKPYIRFVYIGSLTSKDREKILDSVKHIAGQYEAVDADAVYEDIEFDDLDDVMHEIKEEKLESVLED